MAELGFDEISLASKDYGYVNARVRGFSAKLLKREIYQQLLAMGSVADMNAFLSETDYAEELAEVRAESGDNISQVVLLEKAIELNFEKTLDFLKSILAGEPRVLFELLIEKWDVQNLKTVLRYNFANIPMSKEKLSFPGHLPESFWDNLTQQPSVADFIKYLETWNVKYAPQLNAVYTQETGTKGLLILERALDMAYYSQLLAITGRRRENYRVVNEFIKKEVDIINLINALRLVKAGISAEETLNYFVPGGEKFTRLNYSDLVACSSLKNALELLRKYSYREAIEKRNHYFEKVQDVAVFERSLEEQMLKWLSRMYMQGVLGFGVLLGYLRFKYVELTNLRILGRCKEFGVPNEIIWEELILVR